MLGDIDYLKSPVQPQLFLVRPDLTLISKIAEAYDIHQSLRLASLNELSFKIPYDLDRNHLLTPNRHTDWIKGRYVIQVELGDSIERYVISNINEKMEDGGSCYFEVKCFLLPFELKDKLIRDVSLESSHAEQVLSQLLASTLWSIDYLDADFKLTYRTFDFTNTTVLDAIYNVAETYNAVIQWDTVKRTISMHKPEFFGINKGLKFSYGHYLKTLDKDSKADEMVTRLKAYGHEGLSIHAVNPSGQPYIEDYSYFMYPFQRDANRQVLSSSSYMSDSLCHSLLDYAAYTETKRNVFDTYFKERRGYELLASQQTADLDQHRQKEASTTDIVLNQQFDKRMFFDKYNLNNSLSNTTSFSLAPHLPYAVFIKLTSSSSGAVSLNGNNYPVPVNQWVVLGKLHHINTASISVSSNSSTEVYIQVANISLDEYNTASNEQELIEKYSLDYRQAAIRAKQAELESTKALIAEVKQKIALLQKELDSSNHFTEKQLEELNVYVIEKEFVDDKYVDQEDLLKAAWEKLKELQRPQTSFSISAVNFLALLEEQHNWDKLVLGDYVTVQYEKLNTNIEARISEITYNYENSDISLTISNVKEISDDYKKIEKFIYDSQKTTTTVDSSKQQWDKAVVDSSEIHDLFTNFWNKVTNDINMASNEYVTIDRKGITITDPHDSLRFLRATHGALGLTRSGGLRYETAITPDGLIAEQVLGKIITSNRVIIGDNDGLFLIEGAKATITDKCKREVMKIGLYDEQKDKFGILLNRYYHDPTNPALQCNQEITNRVIMNESDGLIIQRKRSNSYENTLYTSLDGDLFMKGNFQAGEGERVFKVNHEGLSLGASNWSDAPLHADYYGTVWMNKLIAKRADITESTFKNGHIEGSSLFIGQGDRSFSVYPQQGIWAGSFNFASAPFSVTLDGTLKTRKAIITNGENKLLIDSEAGKINLNNFDIEGVGRLSSEMIAVKMITAEGGYISDLTVNKVNTLWKDEPVGSHVNYVEIKDHAIKFITAKVSAKEQLKDPQGRPLYWTNQNREMLTPENTGIIAEKSILNPKWEKHCIRFDGDGGTAEPKRIIGAGDGGPNDSAKAVETKYNGGYKLQYLASATARERVVDWTDKGIHVKATEGSIELNSKSFRVAVENGVAEISNGSGSSIQLTADGDILFKAARNMKFNAQRYDFE
ncbi:phage tail spike protein [Paenibacillus sp. UMB4589-SE434]|uniref:phage tail spike protein n=1 Tax=Paenibacillus sp. UMB4589-SE434 TaxID=3046314 RepID=UPI00254D81E9|nr:phage tail spike protein [Paenibacillus sp. UMB4589-SE434]MDK8179411.1 phage tail spike protein [Paenibacillus sp. UMB4589-SE434]